MQQLQENILSEQMVPKPSSYLEMSMLTYFVKYLVLPFDITL